MKINENEAGDGPFFKLLHYLGSFLLLVYLPSYDVRVLRGVVLLVSRVDLDGAVLQEVDLGSLAVVLPLAGELDIFETVLRSRNFNLPKILSLKKINTFFKNYEINFFSVFPV